MIVITGGAGFIGSNLINHFLKKKINNIVSIDFLNQSNNNYFLSENFIKVDPIETFKFLNKNKKKVKIVIHLGAISSTTTKDPEIILENNIRLSFLDLGHEKFKKFLSREKQAPLSIVDTLARFSADDVRRTLI